MVSLRLLFVGNSLTYWKPGLDALFREWGHDAAAVTEGGATLQILWDAGKALNAIRSRLYDIVVLQDDLPEYGRASAAPFRKYVTLFVEAARESESTPIVLLTHSYERLRHTRLNAIALAHQEAARTLDVVVAPSGLTIGYEGLAASTELGTLLSRDREHPLPAGMLLTALLVHAAVLDATGASAPSAAQLEELAVRAIEAGALAGGASCASPATLAAELAALALSGWRWWSNYPTRPPAAQT